ncbi:unnamed protein product [Polarella glacialis]|uniref:EF-hand domain-containing protein n=1 Tax=Polarella glacialis TaxID=89957 RepID=A0A813GXR4_POLGL|nr:unnamed protein product [Polarella glacialis]
MRLGKACTGCPDLNRVCLFATAACQRFAASSGEGSCRSVAKACRLFVHCSPVGNGPSQPHHYSSQRMYLAVLVMRQLERFIFVHLLMASARLSTGSTRFVAWPGSTQQIIRSGPGPVPSARSVSRRASTGGRPAATGLALPGSREQLPSPEQFAVMRQKLEQEKKEVQQIRGLESQLKWGMEREERRQTDSERLEEARKIMEWREAQAIGMKEYVEEMTREQRIQDLLESKDFQEFKRASDLAHRRHLSGSRPSGDTPAIVQRLDAAEVDQIVADLDANGDGELDFDEFWQLMRPDENYTRCFGPPVSQESELNSDIDEANQLAGVRHSSTNTKGSGGKKKK